MLGLRPTSDVGTVWAWASIVGYMPDLILIISLAFPGLFAAPQAFYLVPYVLPADGLLCNPMKFCRFAEIRYSLSQLTLFVAFSTATDASKVTFLQQTDPIVAIILAGVILGEQFFWCGDPLRTAAHLALPSSAFACPSAIYGHQIIPDKCSKNSCWRS